MMHGRFRPEEIVAATRMQVIPAPDPAPIAYVPARPQRTSKREVLRSALWQRRYRTRRPASELDAA